MKNFPIMARTKVTVSGNKMYPKYWKDIENSENIPLDVVRHKRHETPPMAMIVESGIFRPNFFKT